MTSKGRGLSPFRPFLETQGVVILDGGLATTLESYGHDLKDPLWSARLLLEEPEAVRRAHADFLEAGADCIATVTYQATHEGLMSRGLSRREADEAFRHAVALAVDARDAFWDVAANRRGRLRPLVAGSIGPYGAYLADGSEYTGAYGLSRSELWDFHEPRWRILAESAVDILACETIPSAVEAEALLDLLRDTPDRWAWLSFQCRDASHLADGASLSRVLDASAGAPGLAALGANCVTPSLVEGLVGRMKGDGGIEPVVMYPNSGEVYDAVTKTWSPGESSTGLQAAVPAWMESGVQVLGGCCRVLPEQIRHMRAAALDGPRVAR